MPPYQLSSSRTYLEAFARRAAESLGPGTAVLDAGAGTAPYRSYFERNSRYDTADHIASGDTPLTFECDLTAIPADSETYDLVFCSQVLEHVPEPAAVVAELARVLKPGGTLWLSTPLFYPEHEAPYDFFRYTQFGLRHLIEKAGLELGDVEWLEGYLGTAGYQLRYAAQHLPRRPSTYGGGGRGFAIAGVMAAAKPVLERAGRALDRLDERHRVTDRGLPKNYAVVARKTERGAS